MGLCSGAAAGQWRAEEQSKHWGPGIPLGPTCPLENSGPPQLSLVPIPFCPNPNPHLLSVTLPWTWHSKADSAASLQGSGIMVGMG